MSYYKPDEASWEGPQGCPSDCDREGGHLHCDGPLKGDVVRYESPRWGSGQAVVTGHWHYEGCMINVEGIERSLCPGMGETVHIIERAGSTVSQN